MLRLIYSILSLIVQLIWHSQEIRAHEVLAGGFKDVFKMRFIDTTTLEVTKDLLHTQIPEKYAILSHRWREEEVSLHELHETDRDGLVHLRGFRKIAAAAKLAKDTGYDWLWVNTVCIDKTSSADLSESINSMFRWYQNADICFAYLDDVCCEEDMKGSEWFTRGWTLQELIAPQDVLFLNKDWKPIQSRWHLAPKLCTFTNISIAVLRHEVELKDLSVATRMSWASSRSTTRLEDTAYCLLGLFGVNMPLLYGEGENAFLRLQEVILQRTGDASLLAWNPDCEASEGSGNAKKSQFLSALATSPKSFRGCTRFQRRVDSGKVNLCSVMNKGVQITVLLRLVQVWPPSYEAALQCGEEGTDVNRWIVISLTRTPDGSYARHNTPLKSSKTYTRKSRLREAIQSGQPKKLLKAWVASSTQLLLLFGPGHFHSTDIIISQEPYNYCAPTSRESIIAFALNRHFLGVLLLLFDLLAFVFPYFAFPALLFSLLAAIEMGNTRHKSNQPWAGSLLWQAIYLGLSLGAMWTLTRYSM